MRLFNVIACLAICTVLACPMKLLAQEKTVEGVIRDDKGAPLPGATVLIKGTNAAVTTDSSGHFDLRIPSGAAQTLVVSYVGMGSKEVAISNQHAITVTLQAEGKGLDEVVVVGYGTARKKDLTGAVASVKSQQLTQVATPDAVQAVQGRISGVQVVANSGEPGAGAKIRIRGVGSVNSSNPIYVVDGYQTSDISYLAPGDIENMDVLKDASAAAIYGARGANGVVVVTTKKGRSGPVRFTFDGYTGFQQTWRKIPLTNAQQYATLVEEGYTNDNQAVPVNIKSRLDSAIAGGYGAGTNWQDAVFQNGYMQNYSLGLAGGNDVNRFRFSGTYFTQDGIVKNTGLKRYTLNFNDDITVNKWLKGGVNIAFVHSDKTYNNGDLYSGILPNAVSAEPLAQVIDPKTNNWGRPDISLANNPARVVNEIKGNKGHNSTIVANTWAEAKILKGLSFRTQFGATYGNTHNTDYLPAFKVDVVEQRSTSSLTDTRSEDINWLWSNYFTYTQKFGNHSLTALAGAEFQNFHHDELTIEAYNVSANTSLQNINAAQSTNYLINPNNVAFPTYSNGLQSFFGRLNYGYKDRYLLTATVRNDASSKFLGAGRSGVFPSFAGAWIVSDEDFMRNVKLLSLLKLRAGWGRVGNEQSAGPYPYATLVSGGNLYSFNNQAASQGFAANSYGNPLLKWETNQQANFGFDLGLLRNSLTLTADYFNRKTIDMILPVPIPVYSGAPASPYMNTGTMLNKGVEITANYTGGKAFHYSIGGNITFLSNKITTLGRATSQLGGSVGKLGNIAIEQTGEGFPSFYGLRTDGIFHSQAEVDAYKSKTTGQLIQPLAKPGDVKFVDMDGSGAIDGNDRVVLGNPNPTLQYGFNADFSYKNFDLHFFLQGVGGNKIVNALIYNTRSGSNSSSSWNNMETVMLNRWTPTNTHTNIQRMTTLDANNNSQFSDRYVQSGAYLRMKNIQLGYTLPKALTGQWGISSLRFYVSADNVFTVTKYAGFDPEVSGYYSDPFYTGVDVGGYPQARTYRFGVNLGF